GIFPGQTSADQADAFVRKYDASGNELWTRQFGTAGIDVAHAVAADATGVYVAGVTDGAFTGQTNVGSRDAFVVKLDKGVVLPVLQQVNALIAQVKADMAAGILTNGQGTSMINSALKQITETTGIAQIDKFISDVKKLVNQGKLSQADADPLLEAAYLIRAGLTS